MTRKAGAAGDATMQLINYLRYLRRRRLGATWALTRPTPRPLPLALPIANQRLSIVKNSPNSPETPAHMKTALLLLALMGLAAARCPEGMAPIPEDEMDAAAEIGLNRRVPAAGLRRQALAAPLRPFIGT